MFECYNAPAVCYTVDALCSWKYNVADARDGLIISSGFESTHVIPMVAGRARFDASARISVGALSVHRHAIQHMRLRYPEHRTQLSHSRIRELVENYAEISPDSLQEGLARLKTQEKTRLQVNGAVKQIKIQLPYEVVPQVHFSILFFFPRLILLSQ
jgi:actin-related protein 5